MAILPSNIKILGAGQTERIKNGCTEHRHGEYDYWHPVARVHSGNQISTHRSDDTTRTMWDVDEDGVYDIIEALSGTQTKYIDMYGDTQEFKQEYGTQISSLRDIELFSYEWANALASVNGIHTTEMLCRSGVEERPTDITVSNGSNVYGESVKIHTDPRGHGWYEVTFEEGTQIVDAMRFADAHRISVCDAMHVMYVSNGGSYYDLIRLPNGGHIPTEILVEEYGVSWETIAKIPLGKPRDNKTFACPICEETSFFAGVCEECDDICHDCDSEYHCETSGPCMYYVEKKEILDEVGMKRFDRKEFENGAILRMLKYETLDRKCRYMIGGD